MNTTHHSQVHQRSLILSRIHIMNNYWSQYQGRNFPDITIPQTLVVKHTPLLSAHYLSSGYTLPAFNPIVLSASYLASPDAHIRTVTTYHTFLRPLTERHSHWHNRWPFSAQGTRSIMDMVIHLYKHTSSLSAYYLVTQHYKHMCLAIGV